ncbi:MAG: SCO family protein [Pseudomonadota bacterium]
MRVTPPAVPALAIALALALVAPVLLPAPAAAQNGVVLDEPAPIPAFALEDHYGRAWTDEALDGGWTLVMLGFTHCPDVCPFTMANLEAVVAELSLRVRPDSVPQVIFLSVDPDRDRAGLATYARHFHPDFLGVTGEREQIDAIVEATDGFYRFVGEGESYDVQHTSAISVIDPDGMIRAKLQPPMEPGPTAEFLARLQISYRREQTQ